MSTVYSPVSGVAAETATGGTGGRPPTLPPTTYSSPGGQESGGRGQNLPTPEFGKVWGIDSAGKEIYYEGVRYRTSLYVFKYKASDRREVWRGTVETDPSKPGYQTAKWDRGSMTYDTFRARLTNQGVKIGAKPGDLPSNGSSKPAGSVARPATATTPIYYFMHEVDSQGRERVWAFDAKEGKYLQGILEVTLGPDGKVISTSITGVQPLDTPVGAPANGPGGKPVRTGPSTALVVTDGVTYGNTGSGNAEVTSPQSERIYYRPSRLQRTMNWTTAKSEAFKKVFLDIKSGVRFRPAEAPMNFDPVLGNGEFNPSTGSQIGMGIASFYAAMGMVAAYELMMEHPNNPMVLEQYFENFDAIHALQIGGFMALAYPFMKRVQGFSSSKSVIRSVPMFAAGLFAGAVGSLVVTMAADSDVQACIVTNWKDLPACDRAQEKFFSKQLELALVPQLASMMVTGALFLGSYYVINATGLAAALRSMPILKGAKPGPVGLGLMLFSGVVWMTADKISTGLFNVENFVRERMIVDSDVEDRLFSRWEQLRRDKWVDVIPEPATLPNCVGAPRVGITNHPCHPADRPPEHLTFSAVLDQYSDMLSGFRNTQLSKTYAAYNAWSGKVSNYHAQMGASYELYADFIKRIDFEKKNPGLSESDARGFNPITIRNLERQRIDGNIYPAAKDASAWEIARGLDKDQIVVSDPVYSQDFSDTWKYVATRNLFDYAVTSMACGPETEGQSENSVMQNVGQFMSDWVTGNTAPSNVIGDPAGYAMVFHPPRITKPRPGTNRSVCEKAVGRDAVLDTIFSPLPTRPQHFVVAAPWFSGLKNYKDLYEFIKDNVRESILVGGQNHFDSWWENSVTAPAMQTELDLRAEYEKMLKENYVPTLLNQNYYWCAERETKGLGFYPHWLKLASSGPADCGATRLHRLGRGLINSLRDELRLYMALTIDLYASSSAANVTSVPQAGLVQAATDRAKAVLDAYDQYVIRATLVDGTLRPDADLARTAAVDALEKFKASMIKVADGQIYTREQELMQVVMAKIEPILKQTQTFYTVLKAFEQPTEAELAAAGQ